MSPNEPEDSDGDWVKRYRQASEIDSAMPSPAAREAILAEGRRVAAARAANPATHKFDTKQLAANQPRWKLAAAGTLGAALLAAVLMYPHLGAPPTPIVAEMAPTTASSPVPDLQFKKQTEVRESVADAPVEEVVVTGARQRRVPDRTAERKTESVSPPTAASIGADAGATPRGAQDATSQFEAGARTQRAETPAAAPPAALSSATAAQAVRSNLMSDSLLSSVAAGDLAHASALLNEGANPDQMDSMGRTCLLLAVTAHRDDLVGLLLAHHANPEAADQSGQTPLQRARLDGQLNIVRLLERAGAR